MLEGKCLRRDSPVFSRARRKYFLLCYTPAPRRAANDPKNVSHRATNRLQFLFGTRRGSFRAFAATNRRGNEQKRNGGLCFVARDPISGIRTTVRRRSHAGREILLPAGGRKIQEREARVRTSRGPHLR